MVFFPSRAIALSVGPVAIHWYGIMYALAFLLGFWLLPRMFRLRKMEIRSEDVERLSIAVILGVLLGGRLGFVLFYEPSYFLAHPLEILFVWRGGMSSHGGFIGVIIALLLCARSKNMSLPALADVIVVPVAIGLAFGRLGNFINGELYGTLTALPWGMRFPGVDGFHHPTQLYAIAKDLFIASVCFIHLKKAVNSKPGTTASLFLILYGVLRFIVEIFREQPYGFVSIGGLSLSWGQVLTLPIFVLGVVLLIGIRGIRVGVKRIGE